LSLGRLGRSRSGRPIAFKGKAQVARGAAGHLARRSLHSAFALIGLIVAVFFLARLTGDPTNSASGRLPPIPICGCAGFSDSRMAGGCACRPTTTLKLQKRAREDLGENQAMG
jgi:hypothetical protein